MGQGNSMQQTECTCLCIFMPWFFICACGCIETTLEKCWLPQSKFYWCWSLKEKKKDFTENVTESFQKKYIRLVIKWGLLPEKSDEREKNTISSRCLLTIIMTSLHFPPPLSTFIFTQKFICIPKIRSYFATKFHQIKKYCVSRWIRFAHILKPR